MPSLQSYVRRILFPKCHFLRKVFIIVCCFLLFLMVYLICQPATLEFDIVSETVNAECNIPNIDPYDDSIKKYIFHPDPLQCSSTLDLTFIDENGLVQINKTACKMAGFKVEGMTCEYSAVERFEDDDKVKFKPAVPLSLPGNVPADFFSITCKDELKHKYSNLHAHVFKTSKTQFYKKSNHCSAEKYNVLIFGLDSISRLNGLRTLQKTHKYLTETLGAYDFHGYTKVGANTFPNVVPILTGKNPSELPVVESDDFYDIYPLVWKNFSECGYITMYSEDAPFYSAFNYLSKGFYNQPTNHYMRPYWLAMRDSNQVQYFLNPVWLALEDRRLRFGKSTLCFGGLPKHVLLTNYYRDFMHKYQDHPLFGFSWLTELGHDYLNIVEVADNDFLNFLKFLHTHGHLKDTFLFFMSDHGHRFDWLRQTLIGRIEDKMPLLLIKVPEKFENQYPDIKKTLEENTQRLTSPFDVHKTLKEILLGTYDKPEIPLKDGLGISLFRPISKHRTCAQAGISEHYCSCYKMTSVEVTNPVVNLIATFVLNQINSFTKEWRQKCEAFRILSIKNAQKRVPMGGLILKQKKTFFKTYQIKKTVDEGDYTVVIETIPGSALFEGTVSYYQEGWLKLLGDISRINKYGNQSQCLNKRLLKPFCYCLS